MSKKRIEEMDKNFQTQTADDGLQWIDANQTRLGLRGLPWIKENKGFFCRLPKRAEKIVRPDVWGLAHCTAGAHLAFCTDATELSVRMRVPETSVMAHITACGQMGASLYCGKPGQMRPWGTLRPDAGNREFSQKLLTNLPKAMREYRIYFPLYKHVEALEVGVNKGATFQKATPPRLPKPITIYGTSITQGGCANTAGTDFVNILSRKVNMEIVNLGFSGNGLGEPELADLMREVDSSLFILDYAANTRAEGMKKTLPKFIKRLRDKHPTTPILLVSNVCYWSWDFAKVGEDQEHKRDAMMSAYLACRKKGDMNIHFADGLGLIPFGADCAYVDGVHPTDHGFQLMADGLSHYIERILFPQQ